MINNIFHVGDTVPYKGNVVEVLDVFVSTTCAGIFVYEVKSIDTDQKQYVEEDDLLEK